MRPLYLFRPEPGWSVTAETARGMGLTVRGAPLFEIEPVEWTAPSADGYDGLLVGSANVFRHGGIQLETLTLLPVHAVGETTADAARSAGFLIGRTGGGGLQGLLDDLSGRNLRLFRLAGEEHVELAVPDGIAIDTRVVYRAVSADLPEDEVAALRNGGVVALHSGAAARILDAEFDRHGIDKLLFDLVAIGPRVADLAGSGWRSVEIPSTPDDSEMLALAKGLCQTSQR